MSALAGHVECDHIFDFSNAGWINTQLVSGFGGAEPHGRWTDGPRATFSCSLSAASGHRAQNVRIETGGFAVDRHPQRVRIEINGVPAGEFRYTRENAIKAFELSLEGLPENGRLQIGFTLPDAISRRDPGMSDD